MSTTRCLSGPLLLLSFLLTPTPAYRTFGKQRTSHLHHPQQLPARHKSPSHLALTATTTIPTTSIATSISRQAAPRPPLQTEVSEVEQGWSSFFDEIYCINLVEAVSRREHAQRVFGELGVSARMWTVQRDYENSERGCFNSHLSVVRHAYESGYENVVIFEDDVNVMPRIAHQKGFDNAMEEVVRHLSENRDWEIFYLGYSQNLKWDLMRTPMRKVGSQGSRQFVELNRILGAHAYIINRACMAKLLHYTYCGEGVDFMYDTIGLKQSSTVPMLFYGDASFPSTVSHSDLPGLIDAGTQAFIQTTAVIQWATVVEDMNMAANKSGLNLVQPYFANLIFLVAASAAIMAGWVAVGCWELLSALIPLASATLS